MILIEENNYVAYQLLDNGIHQLELKDNTRTAIDAYLNILDEIIRTNTENHETLIRIMIIISSKEMPSLQYLAAGAKKVLARYPERPPFRNVYMFQQGFMANLLQMFIKMVVQRGNDKVNFYHIEKIDAAEAWLLDA